MSILIKGMDMPENCFSCLMRSSVINRWCNASTRYISTMDIDSHTGRANWCPLVEVPTPHGRLIDADAMTKEIERWKDHPNKYIRNRNEDFIFYLNDAETVVESEE